MLDCLGLEPKSPSSKAIYFYFTGLDDSFKKLPEDTFYGLLRLGLFEIFDGLDDV